MKKKAEGNTEQRPTFDWFKSEVCHQVKNKGDLLFIRELLEPDVIRSYFDQEWYVESLYLLAMLDYLSRENDIPLCTRYNDLRTKKLAGPLFPLGVIMAADLTRDDSYKENCIRDAIPEFMRHNIVECDIRDVV